MLFFGYKVDHSMDMGRLFSSSFPLSFSSELSFLRGSTLTLKSRFSKSLYRVCTGRSRINE